MSAERGGWHECSLFETVLGGLKSSQVSGHGQVWFCLKEENGPGKPLFSGSAFL